MEKVNNTKKMSLSEWLTTLAKIRGQVSFTPVSALLYLCRPGSSFSWKLRVWFTMGISSDCKHVLFNLHREQEGFGFLFHRYSWNSILSAIPSEPFCLVLVQKILSSWSIPFHFRLSHKPS